MISRRPKEFEPMLAAYKLRLARKASELGQEFAGTWGKQKPISVEREERSMAGDGDFRLSPFPYPGLRSFGPKEGKLFFGRENNVTEVRRHLAECGIVTVLGGSGSGKSSLVRAGLLPYLNGKRRIPGRTGSWYVAEFRPRTNPLRELADALADQIMLPLLDLEAPGLAEAMGLKAGDRGEVARPKLHEMMRKQFESSHTRGREALRETLLDFVDRRLDDYDRLASEGVRVPGASLMLLVDQFEEVFRSEIDADQQKGLLDLMVDLGTCLGGRNERNERTYKGGLFLVVTMRSEELHRCAEHRGLSEVVNRSIYLLELLDPDNQEDAKDLHKAIVQPARDVLDDWGVAYDRNKPDAPYADGMPDWLLLGDGRRLSHQADQLPLLQHALQATWHAAMRRWSKDDFSDPRLEIRREDLPGQGDSAPRVPDLGKCLDARANKAAERAMERFAVKAGTSIKNGEMVLQGAFRALAHRDDRGNWARRFADIADIMAYLAADPNSSLSKAPQEAVQDALSEFVLRGYLSGGDDLPYDISHEALIRNWPRFQEWLRQPEAAARALERVAQEIDPQLGDERRQKLLDWFPTAISEQLTPIFGPGPTLPRSWALQHLEPMLERSTLKERWQGLAPNADNVQLAQMVLKKIDKDREDADRERGREVSLRIRRKLSLWIGSTLVIAALLGVLFFWFVLEKSTADLYAAHSEALLGAAISDRGAQMPHELRARVALRAASYFDGASELAVEWLPEKPAQLLLRFITGARLPILPNKELLERPRSAFDSTSRIILGRNSVITKSEAKLVEEQPAKCVIVADLNQRGPVNQSDADWQTLTLPLNDKWHLRPAFRIVTSSIPQFGSNSLLQFGVENGSRVSPEVYSDFQDSLPPRAQICLSLDATVLTVSNLSQGNPDLYDLQWTPCALGSDCTRKYGFKWRVRAVPIQIVPGADDLKLGKFPCVTSIAIVPVPVGADAGRRYQNPAKVQVMFTDEEQCPAPIRDRQATRGIGQASGPERPKLPGIFMTEFFTELAVPRTVEFTDSVANALTECKSNMAPASSPIPDAESICKPTKYVDTGTSLKKVTYIGIRKRENENDILEVDVLDEGLATFAAHKVSLPAHHIHRAGITSTGEVLLHDDDAAVTWRFVVERSKLEARLRERGKCSSLQRSDPKDQEKYLGDLAKLNVDSAC
jgi:hypothetical protein